MQPIPVVYGMTPGEYARMLMGERWIGPTNMLTLNVIYCKNYKHDTRYQLPVAPSPNLKTMTATYLYPSLCFFEGTVVSVGRGTDKPFQQWGHPALKKKTSYYFVPKSKQGASKPLYEGQRCYGELVTDSADSAYQLMNHTLNLTWLIKAYNMYPKKDSFFNAFFDKLAGTKELRMQIAKGMTAEEIHQSWQPGIQAFKKIRRKYVLYE